MQQSSSFSWFPSDYASRRNSKAQRPRHLNLVTDCPLASGVASNRLLFSGLFELLAYLFELPWSQHASLTSSWKSVPPRGRRRISCSIWRAAAGRYNQPAFAAIQKRSTRNCRHSAFRSFTLETVMTQTQIERILGIIDLSIYSINKFPTQMSF